MLLPTLLLTLLMVVVGGVSAASSESQMAPLVETREGVISGVVEESVKGTSTFYAYYSVPYAKPPVGNLRFKVTSFFFFHSEFLLL